MASSGLLILDKPHGIPSFKAVQALKRRFRWTKAGHVGTLDPLATGVLPICVGKATRLIPYIMECEKGYEALIRLGAETLTQDREGAVTRMYCGRRYPSPGEVEGVLGRFRGEVEQVPPMYSALKYKGRRLYEWARDGKDLPRNPRMVRIDTITCLAYTYPFLLVDITCGRGTYIRSLAADIGRALGTGGHLWALRRLRVGEYTIERSLQWGTIERMRREEMEDALISMGEMLHFLPAIQVDLKGKAAMAHGRTFTLVNPPPAESFDNNMLVRVEDPDGVFLGLGGVIRCTEHALGLEISIKPSMVIS
ncbi:MAG: tRNA pseudouridine(55) synthase TruB [bacterium]